MATLSENDLISESVPPPGAEEIEEGPPSAPRLREAQVDEPALDAEAAEQEPDVTEPPPESGRQQVAQAVTADDADALDMDIAVTVSDSTPPPPPAPAPVASSAPVVEMAAAPLSPEVPGPQPRLALVSEPEINLHTPPATPPPPVPPAPALPVIEEAPPPPAIEPPQPASDRLDLVPESCLIPPATAPIREDVDLAEEVELAVSVPDQPSPAPQPVAASAPAERPISEAPPSEPGLPAISTPPPVLAPVPVRLMAQPSPAPSAHPLEVWASTHAAPSLRGQVASFVGQNVSFAPKSFGEIVDASLELGK